MPAIPDLPSRHESLITRVALDATDPGVIAATRRIESRRLKSEGDLRRSLAGYLRRSDQELGGLRPRDLLSAYEQYATETFRAAGEAYSGLFPSQEAFASALTVVTEWIVEEIVPGPQTVRERRVHQLTRPSTVLALGQKFGFAQNPDPTLLEEAEKNAPVLKDLASSVHPDWDIDASVLDDPIIPLDEPVSHFCNRTGILDRRAESFNMLRGGLWESLIDRVSAELVKTNEDRSMTYSYANELQLALRSWSNRDTAEEILRVAMEHETPNALGAWWELSNEREGGAQAGTDGPMPEPRVASAIQAETWGEVEIRVLSDHRLETKVRGETKVINYAEMGFEDRRHGKANKAWAVLLVLARAGGTMRDAEKNSEKWAAIAKQVERLRKVLEKHFGLSGSPLVYTAGTGYVAQFKISRAPSADT